MHQFQLAHQLNQEEYMMSILKIFTHPTPANPTHLQYLGVATDIEYDDGVLQLPPNTEVIPLKAQGSWRRVVACDTSTIKVAEGVEGSLWALRGCIVIRDGDRTNTVIFGPFLYTLTQSTAATIIRGLYEILGCRARDIHINTLIAPKTIANLFDRILQHQALRYLRGGMMLLDGSLTAGPLDSPAPALRRLLDEVRVTGYGVLAISKSTGLVSMGRKITELARGSEPPFILKPTLTTTGHTMQTVLGEVYVARLAPGSYPFRVDVAPAEGVSVGEVFQTLLSSDSLIYGYPETLSLAHQLATFNRIDVMCLRAAVKSITRSDEFDVRSSIFGPLDG